MQNQEQHETYVIPPNFVDTGTFFGGSIKIRNAIEAGVLTILITIPVFHLPVSLTTKIIIWCLSALPIGIFAIIGVAGESLGAFLIHFIRYFFRRRILFRSDITERPEKKNIIQWIAQKRLESMQAQSKPVKTKKAKKEKLKKEIKKKTPLFQFSLPKRINKNLDEFQPEPILKKKRKRRRREWQVIDEDESEWKAEDSNVPNKKWQTSNPSFRSKTRKFKSPKFTKLKNLSAKRKAKKLVTDKKKTILEDYMPISKIDNGIIYTKDKRFIKILELEPINFSLRSAREQRSIIYSFVSYLKIAPVKLQFKCITRKADINKHLDKVREEIATEENEACKVLQRDYAELIRSIGSREAIARRFLLVFEYEPILANQKESETEIVATLETAAHNAKTYMRQCGNEVLDHDNENEFLAEVFYLMLCRSSSSDLPFSEHVRELVETRLQNNPEDSLDHVQVSFFFTPEQVSLRGHRYLRLDGQYVAYLYLPSNGYKTRVSAAWTSLLINAGDGVDVDIFLQRLPKDRIQRKIGQELRINASKIKETSSTNTDFDDLEDAISSGYFLKDGLANNQDFYFMNILITITAETEVDLEWKIAELTKHMASQDFNIKTCAFFEEQAFLSSLPLCKLDKTLYQKSKRNVLTLGAASCYPLSSFEMSDENGILLGVNKHNNSMVIVDIFNSKIYKNANMAILGTSGAGKTFTLQLMALRMRRKGIQVFIVAPLKGHEFYRACSNIGGQFISISPASKSCINIMEIRKTNSDANELIDGISAKDKSELAAKIQRLHIFFSLLIPDMNHEERQLLDEALIRTYQKFGITHSNESLVNLENPNKYKKMPILGDLHVELLANPETKRLANILNRLVHGSAKSFNQPTNVDLDNKYVVLDISEITGDLLTVGMFVALDYVWDKAKADRTKEKAIFLDELWQLIGASSNRLAAEFVLEIFKIIRGYGGSAICATQDLNDFFALEDGKYGKGIINNSKTKIILNLEDDEAMRVQNILKLSEVEVMNITHFAQGNGLISTNNNNVTVEFKHSQLEHDLITTDRAELRKIAERKMSEVS